MTRALIGGVLCVVEILPSAIPLRGRGRPRGAEAYVLVGEVGRVDMESIEEDARDGVEPETEETRCNSRSFDGVGR